MSLTIFGFATEWTGAALEAMTQALPDVDWAGPSSADRFVPRIDIEGRTLQTIEGMASPPQRARIDIELVTPLALGGVDPRERPAGLIVNLARRIEALARWHDATLEGHLDLKALGHAARALVWDFDVTETRWMRGSKRQDREIPMRGLLGQVAIKGDLAADIATLLAFGETCHWGGDVAFGCGRMAIRRAFDGPSRAPSGVDRSLLGHENEA